VPAMIFIPSESIALANCLASLSVGNVLVCLACARLETSRHCLGASTETNQQSEIVRLLNSGDPSAALNSARILRRRSRSGIDIDQYPALMLFAIVPTSKRLRCYSGTVRSLRSQVGEAFAVQKDDLALVRIEKSQSSSIVELVKCAGNGLQGKPQIVRDIAPVHGE
jgi:hypothetical protein